MKGWNKKKEHGIGKRLIDGFIGGLITILCAVSIPLILDRCSITDSRLIHVGLPLPPTSTEIKASPNGMFEYHVKHGVRLKNTGWRKGHVDRVEVARHGLKKFPEEVTVLHVDRTDLGWLEEKLVEYEFIALLKPFPEKEQIVSFRTTYYGSTGDEIYTEFSTIVGERYGP